MVNIRKYFIPVLVAVLVAAGSASHLFKGEVSILRGAAAEISAVDLSDPDAAGISAVDAPEAGTVEAGAEPDGACAQSSGAADKASSYDCNAKVDINSAGMDELQTAPGIGPAKARAIIEYRELYGNFSCLEELCEVKGIGAKTLDKLRDYYMIK